MPQPILLHITSLGCSKNLVDTEVICGQLALAGILPTTNRDDADIVLVNTCAFIEPARDEAYEVIADALRWKRGQRRRRRVVVAGCLPQKEMANVRRRFPQVDLFLGIDDIGRAADRIAALLRKQRPAKPRGDTDPAAPTFLYDHTHVRLPLTPASYAYVKIADGCDNRCAYCTIPDIRGAHRSRAPDSVLEECRQLLDLGVCELDLIAQDITRYAADRADGTDLTGLLRRLGNLPGDLWVRLLYAHPAHLDDDTIRSAAETPHVVPYLDLPIQHISDHILRDMGRGIGGAATRKRLATLRDLWPGVTLRSTLIVGFPGETDADFDELLAFVEGFRFERLGVFCYCPEPGTRAMDLPAPAVPPEVAAERRDQLLRLQQQISLEHNREALADTMTVLIDGWDPDIGHLARTTGDAPEIDNLVVVQGLDPDTEPGFARVRITDADVYELIAVVA